MILKIALLTAMMTMLACGAKDSGDGGAGPEGQETPTSKPCAQSVVVGSWKGSLLGQTDVLTFNSDCVGTSSYCESQFTYPNVPQASGNIQIVVQTTNGHQGCPAIGPLACQYNVKDANANFSCSGVSVSYLKQ